MASTVTVDGRPYLRRNPLGVVGLTLITFGIYGLYWWWKINDELRLVEGDDSISPTRPQAGARAGLARNCRHRRPDPRARRFLLPSAGFFWTSSRLGAPVGRDLLLRTAPS